MGILDWVLDRFEYLVIDPEPIRVYSSYQDEYDVHIKLKNPYAQKIRFEFRMSLPPTVTMQINDNEYTNKNPQFMQVVDLNPGSESNYYVFFKHNGELHINMHVNVFVEFYMKTLLGYAPCGKSQQITIIPVT